MAKAQRELQLGLVQRPAFDGDEVDGGNKSGAIGTRLTVDQCRIGQRRE
jgi:hypothetical protein